MIDNMLPRNLDDIYGPGAENADDEFPRAEFAEQLDVIAVELNHYAYGKDEVGERYPEWEEIAVAFAALERAIKRLRSSAQ